MYHDGSANQSSRIVLSHDSGFNNKVYTVEPQRSAKGQVKHAPYKVISLYRDSFP